MAITITDDAMTSDVTRHTARVVAGGWQLSWLPGRVLDYDQATTGMVLAEAVQAHELTCDHPMWPHIDGWAAELGLSGPDAVVRVSDPPQPPGVTGD